MDYFETLDEKIKNMPQLIKKSFLGGFVYIPTGKKIKHLKVCIDPDWAPKLKQNFDKQNFTEINAVKKTASSSYIVEIFATEDASICLLQMLQFVPYNFEAITDVIQLQGEDALKISKWGKS